MGISDKGVEDAGRIAGERHAVKDIIPIEMTSRKPKMPLYWVCQMSNNTHRISFMRWRQTVDQTLSSNFAITINDAGIPESDLRKGWQSHQTAKEYVAYYSEKYDLIHLDEWRAIIRL